MIVQGAALEHSPALVMTCGRELVNGHSQIWGTRFATFITDYVWRIELIKHAEADRIAAAR